MTRASLLLALSLTACPAGDWTLGDDLAPKQPLPTQSDGPGYDRVPWNTQDLDAGDLHVFDSDDAGPSTDGGDP